MKKRPDAADSDEQNTDESPEPALDSELLRLQQERDEFKDRFARCLADQENSRKRMQRELEEGRRYAVGALAKDVIEVIDNLQRALAGVPPEERDSPLAAGVRMVQDQMLKLLEAHGVQPIEAVGRPFDPTLHQAIATEDHPEFEPGTVTSEMVRGYRLHDRLLRPAMVMVAKGGAKPARSVPLDDTNANDSE